MPELPEVETTRRGISPHIEKQRVQQVVVRQAALRWPVSGELVTALPGLEISKVERRGKYLLIGTAAGHLIIHLGMSGSLRILEGQMPPGKHDHVDIQFEHGRLLRYTDPRRFGCLLWHPLGADLHPLLSKLGPEPLGPDFDGDYLFASSRGRRSGVKTFIMDSQVVVGVGNIYANEALFIAGIHPRRAAGRISRDRYRRLAKTIREVLQRAIEVGGTTLRDFTNESGDPGYFKQSLKVYGRAGMACELCGRPLKEIRLGQRSTVYCTSCQT